jgi:hypothetical protein
MSNRGRQNVASFLALDQGIDWRKGADWFEHLLLDYDVCRCVWGGVGGSGAWVCACLGERVYGFIGGARRSPMLRTGLCPWFCVWFWCKAHHKCLLPPLPLQQLGQLGCRCGPDGGPRQQVQHHQAEQRERDTEGSRPTPSSATAPAYCQRGSALLPCTDGPLPVVPHPAGIRSAACACNDTRFFGV